MKRKLEGPKRILFAGMIFTALGVVLTTTLGERVGSIGIVFIAIGGLLFIVGLRQRAKDEHVAKTRQDS